MPARRANSICVICRAERRCRIRSPMVAIMLVRLARIMTYMSVCSKRVRHNSAPMYRLNIRRRTASIPARWKVFLVATAVMVVAYGFGRDAWAQSGPRTVLEVAYAGSMGSLMNGGIRPAVASTLDADLHGRAMGSTALGNMIAGGVIRPDVFIAVTPGPMRTVLKAGKAAKGIPIARTEMVIAYSPKSRFASTLSKASGEKLWRVLETPGFRFGRTDPLTDPQGANIIFTMRLAALYYNQPALPEKILGSPINPHQIFQEPEVMARLQAGQLDASSAYKTQPAAFNLPFIALPKQVNLSDAAMQDWYGKAAFNLNGKEFRPSPLIFYAAVLNDAPHRALAAKFVEWLRGPHGQSILARYHYDSPAEAPGLTP
jgi:molybdate/tungstate transport system substrate-binding protein